MAEVEFRGVTSQPRGGRSAIVDVSLRLAGGEVLALLGPSGSGKTTLLRLAAGLEPLHTGEVLVGGTVYNDVPAHERDLALVTEDHAPLTHLDVEGNIAFSLRLRKVPAVEARKRVRSEARVFGLSRLLRRRPGTLSAGQRQAVSVARATVRVPSAYLLDEPLSRIDARERLRLRAELSSYVRGLGVTTLWASNDQGDALAVADRVAVLRDGHLEQVASPSALYSEPANAFVATFVGDPGMNVVQATLEAGRRSTVARVGEQSVTLVGVPEQVRRSHDGAQVLLGVRPEHLDVLPDESSGGLPATVERCEYLGATTRLRARLDAGGERVHVTRAATAPAPQGGERVALHPRAGHALLFDLDTGMALWRAT